MGSGISTRASNCRFSIRSNRGSRGHHRICCCKSICCCAACSPNPTTPSTQPEQGSSSPLLELSKISDETEKLKGKFVIPGSEEQKEISLKMREKMKGEVSDQKECVICLGDFSWEDPEVLTLCSCGMNKALFHYTCLLQWNEKHSYCPSCRGNLFFEEAVSMNVPQPSNSVVN
mmetsp:Transcript_4832/g.7329  ORF Transcript_4832/g.7329 Transcript_4832/m.7329 type:complete len:174 (-) Transcript_4832:61-582(-)